MNKNILIITLLLITTVSLSSCKDDEDQLLIDDGLITDYIAANNLVAEKTEEGVYYVETREGTGDKPNVSDQVTVHYKGYTLDGDIFDSSYDRGETSTFPLSGVILGWQIGIPLFKEGGSGTLIIPSHLAYGENPPGGSVIGKNEVLVFDIELFDVL